MPVKLNRGAKCTARTGYTYWTHPYLISNLSHAKLIHSLLSGTFQKAMRAGGHFPYFIVLLIALLERSDCSIMMR